MAITHQRRVFIFLLLEGKYSGTKRLKGWTAAASEKDCTDRGDKGDKEENGLGGGEGTAFIPSYEEEKERRRQRGERRVNAPSAVPRVWPHQGGARLKKKDSKRYRKTVGEKKDRSVRRTTGRVPKEKIWRVYI